MEHFCSRNLGYFPANEADVVNIVFLVLAYFNEFYELKIFVYTKVEGEYYIYFKIN